MGGFCTFCGMNVYIGINQIAYILKWEKKKIMLLSIQHDKKSTLATGEWAYSPRI